MTKKHFVIFFFFLLSLQTFAQFSRKVTFYPGWYLSASSGANYYIGEGYQQYAVTDALGITGKMNIGYHFNPIIGIQGAIEYQTYNWPSKERNYAVQSFTGENIAAELTINLTNLFIGYTPRRVFDFSILGGAGIAASDAMSSPSYMLRCGIQANYYLTRNLSLYLQPEINILNDSYNGYIGVAYPYDLNASVTLGVNYNLPSYKKKLYGHRYNYHLKQKRRSSMTW